MKPICITCKADCHNAGTTSKIVDCSQYKPRRILTNADRIRAMSDEELSDWAINKAPSIGKRYTDSRLGLLDWLQQPAEEEGHLIDYEKLIERLKHDYHGYSTVENNPEETFHDMVECLTALSTLQAENKRLKSLLGEGGQDLWSKENQRADRLEAESEKLRAELEQARESLDFARTKDAEIVRLGKELEQARAEITRLKHYEEKCHDCPIVCAKTEIIKAHEELEAAQNERDMWKEGMEDCQQSILELEAELEQAKRERDAAIDCIYKIEDDLDRGNDNDWAREHISEWESQKED